MTDAQTAKYKMPFLVLAVLFVIWGILGLVDQAIVPYTGYYTDGNNTVVRVYEGSPAEQAGLQVGDYIRSIDGISVEDSRALARRPRAQIGETRTLVVERGTETTEVDIAYSAQPRRDAALGYAAFLIGLCFVVFGLLAYLKAPSASATVLALVGLFLGMAFFYGPYFSSYALRTIVGSLQLVIMILGFAFLLHFLMEFPKRKAFLEATYGKKVLYGPAVLVALFILSLIIVEPPATSTLNVFARAVFGLFIVIYFGLALVAMIHSYAKASPQKRSDYGLNFMLAGVLIGLLPVTIAVLIGTFAPRVVLPGSDFYFLTLVLIPISMGMAVMKSESAPAAVVAA